MLLARSSTLIDAFPVPDGIIVVWADSIDLIGRDRVVKTSVTIASPITAAGFDGQTLAAADAAKLNLFSVTLEPQGTIPLVEPCWDSIMTPAGIFVCEPSRQSPLVFSTFDVKAKKALKQSPIEYYAGGQPMEAASGTPYLVLLSQGSPSTYGLYRLDGDGTVQGVQLVSAYQSQALSDVFQFGGAPASHLVTSYGHMLRLLGPGCDGLSTSTTYTCLQEDGELGTLWPQERFTALANDGAGNLFALVSRTGKADVFDEAPCVNGCAVQRVDVKKRIVLEQQVHESNANQVLFIRPDPSCEMVVVGYRVPPLPTAPDRYAYQVDLLDYKATP